MAKRPKAAPKDVWVCFGPDDKNLHVAANTRKAVVAASYDPREKFVRYIRADLANAKAKPAKKTAKKGSRK